MGIKEDPAEHQRHLHASGCATRAIDVRDNFLAFFTAFFIDDLPPFPRARRYYLVGAYFFYSNVNAERDIEIYHRALLFILPADTTAMSLARVWPRKNLRIENWNAGGELYVDSRKWYFPFPRSLRILYTGRKAARRKARSKKKKKYTKRRRLSRSWRTEESDGEKKSANNDS